MLLLIGILAAVAVPRLMTGSRFEDRLQADKLMGLLRQTQLRAMNDPQSVTKNANPSRCAKVYIDTDGFSIANNCDTGLLSADVIKASASQGNFIGIIYPKNTVYSGSALTVQFGKQGADAKYLSEASLLGVPLVNGESLKARLIFSFGGKDIYIEPEGYIHGS